MIRDIFISEDVRLSFGNNEKKYAKNPVLSQFLEKGPDNDYYSASIVFDSIYISDPLKKTGAESYAGVLGCFQEIAYITGADTITTPPEAITVEMFATRAIKIFGADTLFVWEVSLGDMRKDE